MALRYFCRRSMFLVFLFLLLLLSLACDSFLGRKWGQQQRSSPPYDDIAARYTANCISFLQTPRISVIHQPHGSSRIHGEAHNCTKRRKTSLFLIIPIVTHTELLPCMPLPTHYGRHISRAHPHATSFPVSHFFIHPFRCTSPWLHPLVASRSPSHSSALPVSLHRCVQRTIGKHTQLATSPPGMHSCEPKGAFSCVSMIPSSITHLQWA